MVTSSREMCLPFRIEKVIDDLEQVKEQVGMTSPELLPTERLVMHETMG